MWSFAAASMDASVDFDPVRCRDCVGYGRGDLRRYYIDPTAKVTSVVPDRLYVTFTLHLSLDGAKSVDGGLHCVLSRVNLCYWIRCHIVLYEFAIYGRSPPVR